MIGKQASVMEFCFFCVWKAPRSKMDASSLDYYLVGGWTNPIEKYARQIGFIFPKVRGENKKSLKPPPSLIITRVFKQDRCYSKKNTSSSNDSSRIFSDQFSWLITFQYEPADLPKKTTKCTCYQYLPTTFVATIFRQILSIQISRWAPK